MFANIQNVEYCIVKLSLSICSLNLWSVSLTQGSYASPNVLEYDLYEACCDDTVLLDRTLASTHG